MTDTEKIKRITELVNDLALTDSTREDLESGMETECTFQDLKEAMWRLYCFASDVCDTLNM